MCGAFKASGMQDLYSASHQLHNTSQDNCYSRDDRDDYDNEDEDDFDNDDDYDAQPPKIIGILMTMVTTTLTTTMH